MQTFLNIMNEMKTSLNEMKTTLNNVDTSLNDAKMCNTIKLPAYCKYYTS